MPAKKKRVAPHRKKAASTQPQLPPKLSKTEQDLLWHMSHGYRLETSSLGDNPVLHRLKDDSYVRAVANRRTIESLQKQGLVAMAKAGGVLNPTVWRLTSEAAREVGNDTRRN